jgi:hypothetical protein
MANPATLTVFVAVAALVLLGVLILRATLPPAARQRICRASGCGHKNLAAAIYCARCGARLTDPRP